MLVFGVLLVTVMVTTQGTGTASAWRAAIRRCRDVLVGTLRGRGRSATGDDHGTS